MNEAVERTPKGFNLQPYELGTLLSDSYFDNDKLSEIPELINCNSNDKFIPNDYKLGSIEQRWHLIKGLFDADGNITENNTFDVTYTSISEQLISDIQEVLWSLGVMSTVVDNNEQTGYTLQIKSQNNEKNRFFSLSRKIGNL